MVNSVLSLAVPVLALAKLASAFNCETHTFTTCEDRIVHWYDPDDGQICDPLDCGGGRAPVKTGVPGCANYSGTEVPSVSYLSCWKSLGSGSTTTIVVSSAESTTEAYITSSTAASVGSTTEPEAVETSTTESEAVESTSSTSTIQSAESTAQTKAGETTETKSNTTTQTTAGASASPSTTAAPSLTTEVETVADSTPSASSTPNAAGISLQGSLMAVAGAAVGAIFVI
ncbi:hypothetical protein B0J13DRAFT_40643 [Dactylonectria estremocensis]|uniref:Siderophore biosynthesis n=1 Tax=Dactylonectria estremocensis TaxID=1079267 RepID=A0A9P9EUJ5_9HYPO|nr:hypothetical protein B0J13DRAFT_40643 [Dactylonectria estremocensis]